MKCVIVLLAALQFYPSSALAAVTAKEQIMQSGQFSKANCQSDPKVPDYDDCLCDADIRYPQLAGMSDAKIQASLNEQFKQWASKAVCDGDKVATPEKPQDHPAKSHMSLSMHYEQTFSSPDIMAFKFTDWAYTGGAHGNGSVIGYIVDLSTGKVLSPDEIFTTDHLSAVNQAIYEVLAAKPEEEIFHDQIEDRKGAFIKDNECVGCTLTLTPEGVHVLFQTYEVAPYGAGNTDVLIPSKYVGYSVLQEALEAEKQHSPEKK